MNKSVMSTAWKPVVQWLAICLVLIVVQSRAQVYPVQLTTQLVPPYSVYLSDYATATSERLRVIAVQRDLTQPLYQLRLAMTVELDGRVIMRTSRTFRLPPIALDPGVPTVIAGADMAPYVDARSIDFVGYSRDQYERTRSLPEGSYMITFVAYDYRRPEVQVSNVSSAFYFLAKSEPPLINLPACGSKVAARTPQQIVFSWLPRNISSPSSVGHIAFELSLYETRPEGRNANDVVLSSQPVFRVSTGLTQYVYGPSDPMLLEGMRYVWRVRAVDTEGKDAFRNNGYSEICTFTYGGTDQEFDPGKVTNLHAEAQAERRARIWWDAVACDGYSVSYKKVGHGFEWFTHKMPVDKNAATASNHEFKLFDLEPDTEYETRVQVKTGVFLGAYSDIVRFRTKPHEVRSCGSLMPSMVASIMSPLYSAVKGMVIQVDDIEIQLNDVQHLGDGWYRGTGTTSIAYFGGAVFAVMFQRLFISENRTAGLGRIDFVTRGVASLVHDQLIGIQTKQTDAMQQRNRDEWEGTVFHDRIFIYDQLEIERIVIEPDGSVLVMDTQGNATVNHEIAQLIVTAPDKAIILEDKNGDQHVIQKDVASGETTATRVEGGGLQPGGDAPVLVEDIDIIKKVLRELYVTYSELYPKLDGRLTAARLVADRDIVQHNREVTGEAVAEATDGIMEVTEVEGDPLPEWKAEAEYKTIEAQYNMASICLLLADEAKHDKSYGIIAAHLLVDSQSLPVYLAQARRQGVAEEVQVKSVKGALTTLIAEVVYQYVYGK